MTYPSDAHDVIHVTACCDLAGELQAVLFTN